MDNSFSSLIESANSILILLPTKPYFDQIAAGVSLYLSIRDKKESTIVSCPSPMMVGFSRIIGVDKITSDLGNKNLTIKFANYDGNNIEKVKADLEGSSFVMTIVPKDGFSSPKKEQLEFSYTGVSADLIILIGGANDTHFPAIESQDINSTKIVHIGNRVLSSGREILSFAKSGSTTCEIVADLIKNNSMSMDPDIATNLIMGIEEGSSNFSSVEVTPETFETFAFLLRNGGRRQPKVKLSPASFPPGSIPKQPFNVPVQSTDSKKRNANVPEPVQQVENKEEMIENPPEDWLQPKVYKGTSES